METITVCPVCDGSVVERVYEFDRGFEFYLCKCGAALSPRMGEEEQMEFYDSGEYRRKLGEKVTDEREIALQRARANVIYQQVSGFKYGSHLDIGCSTGELLRRIAEGRGSKFKSVGVDPDPKWPGGVKELYRDIREVKGKFDLITMIQVLEHLNKPQDMMREIKERLSPGGLVVVEVPNRRCYMTAYDSPQHVVAYDLMSLGRLMVKAGLVVIDFVLQDYLHDGPLDLYISMLATNNVELCIKR